MQTCTDCRETTLLVSIEPIFLRPGPDRVLSAVAELTGVPVVTLLSPARTRPVSHARKVAMYLLRTEAGLSHAEVGRLVGRGSAMVITLTRDVAEDVHSAVHSAIECAARAILREGRGECRDADQIGIATVARWLSGGIDHGARSRRAQQEGTGAARRPQP
jgi:hypothetical protein